MSSVCVGGEGGGGGIPFTVFFVAVLCASEVQTGKSVRVTTELNVHISSVCKLSQFTV